MDTEAPATAVSQELTRESLIAISQAVPDNLLSSKLLPDNVTNVNVVQPKDSDGAEDYRSKLISISYTQSPDNETFPASPGNLNY